VLHGGVVRTNFSFLYRRLPAERVAGVELSFEVESDSKPSTNIHSIIGRNGVGKTTILNGMVQAVTGGLPEGEGFFVTNGWAGMQTPISAEYFSSLISVSFSAFDPFEPPPEQSDPSLGTCYYYIGLKTLSSSNSELKSLRQLQAEYISALGLCMSDPRKKSRWHKAITALESDENFSDMSLPSLLELSRADAQSTAAVLMSRMSSGHAVVLLTITKLVAMVEEKTLVLLDEPESHLHPPLLSAFLRALSELLYDRNGVAIIATHSPVVLQEIPTLCAWKINRSRLVLDAKRPEIQTFGENVGVLTREVFGLEVRKSGFHSLLDASVQNGGTFDQIMSEFSYQLGFEAQAILRAMVAYRDSRSGN
jgi:predicted ATPase